MAAKKPAAAADAAAAGPAKPQVLQITVPGGAKVRPEIDMDWGTLSAIAAEHDVPWYLITSAPLSADPTGAAARQLFVKCCEHAGVPVPEKVTARMVYDAVDFVDDDLPTMFVDGVPTTGDPATT